jgi:hypothetical protein
MNGFVKLRAVSKLSTFYTACISTVPLQRTFHLTIMKSAKNIGKSATQIDMKFLAREARAC